MNANTVKPTDRSELVFILDRSGSMYQAAADVIGGFNNTLAENKKLPGECTVTTILFSNAPTLLHDRLPIAAVKAITPHDYQPGGMTALLDAIGFGMEKVHQAHRAMSADYRPRKVQFIIMTDGMENTSREYTHAAIRKLITRAREEYGWDFIFLGANIDAVTAAQEIGISADSAVTAMPDSCGMQAQYDAVCNATRAMRTGNAELRSAWAAPVVADRRRRGR